MLMKVRSNLCYAAVLLLLCFAAISMAGDSKPQLPPRGETTANQTEPAPTVTATQTSRAVPSGEQIKWQVISAGGNRGTSTSYVLSGTVGQTAVGSGTSTSYKLNQGFWQNFAASNCNCGDANGDGTINISDAVFLIQYIFAHGTAPSPICLGDANGDGGVNISDAVYLIQYIFAHGTAPHCP